MNDDYEISVRSRGGSGKLAKHAWSVYAPGGEEVASGVEHGSSRDAQIAAEKAQNEHYMKTRRGA